MVKQYIIVRDQIKTKTGNKMTAAKLAVMVAHASMSFLSRKVVAAVNNNQKLEMTADEQTWMNGAFVKILLKAKNLNALQKAVLLAEQQGMKENIDFFCIRDNCATELFPDDSQDTAFVAIGFRPMEELKIRPVTSKFQCYRDN